MLNELHDYHFTFYAGRHLPSSTSNEIPRASIHRSNAVTLRYGSTFLRYDLDCRRLACDCMFRESHPASRPAPKCPAQLPWSNMSLPLSLSRDDGGSRYCGVSFRVCPGVDYW